MTLTSGQIQQKINQLTREKNDYASKQNNYIQARTYVNKLLNNLKTAKKELNTAEENLKKNFIIGKTTADNGQTLAAINEIYTLEKKINNIIIPTLTSQLKICADRKYYINQEIEKLKRELNNVR